jgi:hypothetical protein
VDGGTGNRAMRAEAILSSDETRPEIAQNDTPC